MTLSKEKTLKNSFYILSWTIKRSIVSEFYAILPPFQPVLRMMMVENLIGWASTWAQLSVCPPPAPPLHGNCNFHILLRQPFPGDDGDDNDIDNDGNCPFPSLSLSQTSQSLISMTASINYRLIPTVQCGHQLWKMWDPFYHHRQHNHPRHFHHHHYCHILMPHPIFIIINMTTISSS